MHDYEPPPRIDRATLWPMPHRSHLRPIESHRRDRWPSVYRVHHAAQLTRLAMSYAAELLALGADEPDVREQAPVAICGCLTEAVDVAGDQLIHPDLRGLRAVVSRLSRATPPRGALPNRGGRN